MVSVLPVYISFCFGSLPVFYLKNISCSQISSLSHKTVTTTMKTLSNKENNFNAHLILSQGVSIITVNKNSIQYCTYYQLRSKSGLKGM